MNLTWDRILTLILFIASFIFLFWFSTYATDFINMDAMLYGESAKNILRGKPYSEIRWIDRPLELVQRTGSGYFPETATWPISPFYVFISALFFSIFGISFNAMKLVGVTFGSLTIVSTFHLAKIQSNKKMGLLAAFLLIIHPYFIYHSIIPGNEVFTSFLAISALLFSFLKNTKGLIFQGLFSALTFMSRYEVGAICLLSVLINHSLHLCQDTNYSIKRELREKVILLLAFTSTLLPLAYNNFIFYNSVLVLPSISTRILFSDQLTLNFYVSPFIFITAIFSILIITLLLSYLSRKLEVLLSSIKPILANLRLHLVFVSIVVLVSILLMSNVSPLAGLFEYASSLYDYSPIFFIFGLTGIFVSLRNIRKYIILYSFLFLSILFYYFIAVVFGFEQLRYATILLPIFGVFGSLAIIEISLKLKLRTNFLPLELSTKKIVVILLLATTLISSFTGYGVLTRSIVINKGPFVYRNWNGAESWIANNTEEDDTIIACWPIPLFYNDRRTITLAPKHSYDNSELYSIINQSQASYLIIGHDLRYGFTNTLIASLYDDPKDYEGFNLVYQTGSLKWEDPRLVIYDVSSILGGN